MTILTLDMMLWFNVSNVKLQLTLLYHV